MVELPMSLQERIREVADVTATPITSIRSAWLYQDEMRLDAGYQSVDAVQARRLIEESSYPVQRLDEIATSVSYPTRFKRVYSRQEYGTPFLSASAMMQFRPISDTYLANRSGHTKKCAVGKGWILITRSGSVGRCVIVGERLAQFAVSDDAIRVQPGIVPSGYLYAFLTSWVGQALLVKDQYGSAINHLESHHVASIPVPCLPPPEMQEIANGIEAAYALREAANRLLDDATDAFYRQLGLPEFQESLVNYLPSPNSPPYMDVDVLRAFTVDASAVGERLDASYHIPMSETIVGIMQAAPHKPIPLGHICDRIFHPGRFRRTYVSARYGVPFIQGSHIPLVRPFVQKYLARSDERNVSQCRVSSRWVLITCSGTIGRVGVVSNAADGWAASQHIARLVAKEPEYNPGYIAMFLMTPYGQHQVLAKVYGAVIDELTADDLSQVLIPNAPKAVRDSIGNKVLEAFEYKAQANLLEDAAILQLESRLAKSPERASNGEGRGVRSLF